MYKKKKGVTLIELLIALSLSAIVSSGIYFFFFSNSNTINKTQYRSDLQGEGEIIIKRLSKTLLQAKKITLIEDTTSSDSLDEKSADISRVKIKVQTEPYENPNVDPEDKDNYEEELKKIIDKLPEVEYTLDKGKLFEKLSDSTGTGVEIGNYIESINFETLYDEDKIISEKLKKGETAVVEEEDKAFKVCKGIKVTINFSRKLGTEDITYQIKSDIVFRNADTVGTKK
ncbi:MAG: PilW family protein [Clostridiaceae bacterium]